MNTWFSSDHHFNHWTNEERNIIKYCNRPFKTIWEMNSVLIDNWNRIVKPDDTVFYLGDFSMGPKTLIAPTRAKLNGYIILIRGNHDRSTKAMIEAGFNQVWDKKKIEINGCKVYLSHHPVVDISKTGCQYALCGHVHEAWSRKGNVINVGVDVRDFKPVSFEELIK